MYHLFLRRRRVENASFIDPKCVVGTELNIGLESQEMFVLISRQSLFLFNYINSVHDFPVIRRQGPADTYGLSKIRYQNGTDDDKR